LKNLITFLFILFSIHLFGQTTKIYGNVKDQSNNEVLPFVKIQFYDSKISTLSDSVGNFVLETYYATDSIQFIYSGYNSVTFKITKDVSQEINCKMSEKQIEIGEITIRPPDEQPSTTLHKRLIANKDANNREKLLSYNYEVYNKIQLDLNNIGDKFKSKGLVQKLDLVLNYLDSTESGETYLPVILSESISEYYYKKNPKKKKEIVNATHITGITNLKLDQFVGDMYLDINVYDNYINIFNKAFVSPAANFARTFYKFYLEDSTFIDDKWCYKLRFKPKRTGDLTFEGEMWINDTTYAIKKIIGRISHDANINYIQDLYFEHDFNEVEPEVWMLTNEKMIASINITENSKTNGLFARKNSSRMKFAINKELPNEFYRGDNTVEVVDSAKIRSQEYWIAHRHKPLSNQERNIDLMVDSLNKLPVFKTLKGVTYFLTTGYYMINKVEIGSLPNIFSVNPVEKYRFSVALRTSNNFSKRLEIGGRLAYGLGDEKLKYAVNVRYNITPKKRGMLTTYYNYDIQQIGQSPNASTVGSTFGTLFRTGPLDKLTFVQKAGINLEKDVKKDLILYGGFEWKEYTPLGKAIYVKLNDISNQHDTIKIIKTSEFIARIRWTKDEEFIAGSFDRSTLTSKYPIFSLQGIFGVKGLFGGDYNYQKIEFQIDHSKQIGVLGKIKYGINLGQVFGAAAYPFLKVHEGNQSYYMSSTAFNKLNFFEFISDRYIGGYVEQHFGGLFFNRIPYVKKLKLRIVATSRATYGSISQKNIREMVIPSFTRKFDKVPYTEASVGIENIFKVLRVDLVWRLTYLDPGMNPLGVRAKLVFNF
jgi:hypothetical protein